MGSGSKTMAFRMISSANDVWTSIVAAPIVYPVGMRELYASIDRLIGDGVIEGSIRDITFGLGIYHLFLTSNIFLCQHVGVSEFNVKKTKVGTE
ncbi:hypothetical protein LINPERPRIM_LOCUS39730 [Linum perenne]